MSSKFGEPLYFQQYITQVTPPRVVWIKYVAEVMFPMNHLGEQPLAVFGRHYWSDAVSGPFEELTEQPFGFHPESYDDNI